MIPFIDPIVRRRAVARATGTGMVGIGNRGPVPASGPVRSTALALMIAAGGLTACVADDPADSLRPSASSGDDEDEGRGDHQAAGSSAAGDRAEPGAPIEPDAGFTEVGVAEDGSEPPAFDRRGLDLDAGVAASPQSELGTTESTVCLGIEVALDEAADGVLDVRASAERRRALRSRAVDGGTVDRRLQAALDPGRGGGDDPTEGLQEAMDRCQELGYRR